MIEVIPLGGMGEIGRNMTAVGFNGEYIIVDMGIRLDAILGLDEIDMSAMGRQELINFNGIPDDSVLNGKNVKAIALTHGHLDHIGAVGKLAGAYESPIYGSPFTIELVKHLIREERSSSTKNELKKVKPGSSFMVGDIEVEFVPITHSILQSVLVVVRGDDKTIVFASDFKIDEKPLLGYKTDSSRLKKLRDEGIFAAFVGAVRVNEPGPTPSESRAREMLRDVMRKADSDSNSILVTTFSSHIARIKSIVDISFEIGRTPVVLGRSLHEYCSTASQVGLVDFPPELHIHGRPNAVRNVLREVEKFRGEYVLILTGHQGEPTSLLTRISDRDLPFKVREGDEIIFSASVIPNPMNESNRRILEAKLLAQGAHIYRDVHVSGHAGRKDTKEFIKMLCPEHLIPCHGTEDGLKIVADIGREIGYSKDQIHMLHNGEKLRLGI